MPLKQKTMHSSKTQGTLFSLTCLPTSCLSCSCVSRVVDARRVVNWGLTFSERCGAERWTGEVKKYERLEGLHIFAAHHASAPSFASNYVAKTHTRKWRKEHHQCLQLGESSQQKLQSTSGTSSPTTAKSLSRPPSPLFLGGSARRSPIPYTTSSSSASADV